MSEVTKKSDTSSSQMRLLGGTPHMCLLVVHVGGGLEVHVDGVGVAEDAGPLSLLQQAQG